MAHTLSRRGFFKMATGIGVATGLSPTGRRVILEPFVQPPEEALPGQGSWYATTCRQCPAACGIIVRVINGRARKIEGNPAHPLNRGKVCARGQAGLQVVYNPDRLRNPVRQSGGRGSRQFEPLAWSEALDQLGSVMQSTGAGGRVGFFAGMLPDHLHTIVGRFLDALGAPAPVQYDLHTALEARTQAARMAARWFGSAELPTYDIARSEVIFSFGANFLETWMSPVAQSFDFGIMRRGQTGGRGFVAQFEPRLSATGASADEWIPVRPGTEGLIALALGRIIVEEDLGNVGSHRDHAHLYRDVSVGDIAQAVDLSTERLQRLARVFAAADRSVAIPGGQLAGLSNADEAMDAVMALNVIMRRLGREGGVFLARLAPAAGLDDPVSASSHQDLRDLIERMRNGEVQVLFVHSANPIYELPSWLGFGEALQSVPTVVSFSPFVDETAVWSDLILPDHTYLESWGYQIVGVGADRPVISGSQPVVEPLYQTRSTADILLALASQLGGTIAEALPWADEVAFLEQMSNQLFDSSISAYEARTQARHWSRWRQFGGWWSEKEIRREPELRGLPDSSLSVPPAVFTGSAESYPFNLHIYPSTTLSDGRGANQPLLQEIPDPMTTTRWNSWLEINPETAARYGIENGMLVRVTSAQGQLEVPAVLFPGIRPDVVAIPLGQGHGDLGRFATGRGVRAMQLIAPASDETQSPFLWASTRVRLEPVGEMRPLARLESLEGEGRESIR